MKWSPSDPNLNKTENLWSIVKMKLYERGNNITAKQIYEKGWLVGFYGISTFVGYLTPNQFLCK